MSEVRTHYDIVAEHISHYDTVIYEALCFDVAQGRVNGAPNETRTHSCRFASTSLLTVTPPEVP